MLASYLSLEDTHKPSMFQSYIKVILSYLRLFYFILNLCIAEQLFNSHISVVYFISSQTRQLLIKHAWIVSWLCKRMGWLCRELALQGNVVQARAGQGFQVQARTYIYCSLQSEILKFHVLALLCVMAPDVCMMHNLQKICQVFFKRIKRIW